MRDEGNVLLAAGLDKIVKKLDQVHKVLYGYMIGALHSDSNDDVSAPVADYHTQGGAQV